MKEELEIKCVLPYFYEFRAPPSVQPRRSITLSSPPAKLTPSNQTMESQQHLMVSSLKLITYSKSWILPMKTRKVVFLVWSPQLMKSKKDPITIKERTLKMIFFKISPAIKCYKCQSYRHVAANCPSPFKIAIKDRVPIEAPKPDSIISPKVTHRSLLSSVLSLPWLYCQHHLLRFLYYWLLLSLHVLITSLFLLYCRYYLLFSYDQC